MSRAQTSRLITTLMTTGTPAQITRPAYLLTVFLLMTLSLLQLMQPTQAAQVNLSHVDDASIITSYADILETRLLPASGKPVTAESVEALPEHFFSPVTDNTVIPAQNPGSWLRLQLLNDQNKSASFLLQAGRYQLQPTQIYIRTASHPPIPADKFRLLTTGKALRGTTIELEAGQQVSVLVHIVNVTGTSIALRLLPHTVAENELVADTLLRGIAIGAILIMLIACLRRLQRSRQSIFAWLGGLMFSLTLAVLSIALPIDDNTTTVWREYSAWAGVLLLGMSIWLLQQYEKRSQTALSTKSAQSSLRLLRRYLPYSVLLLPIAGFLQPESRWWMDIFFLSLSILLLLRALEYSHQARRHPLTHLPSLPYLICSMAMLWLTLDFSGILPLPCNLDTFLLGTIALAFIPLTLDTFARMQEQESRARLETWQTDMRAAEVRARAEFISQINHEIRTPMSGVLGMTELLLDTPLTPNQREFANAIHSSSNNLIRVLNEVLDYTSILSGHIQLTEEHFDIHALLNECIVSLRAQAEQKRIELVVDIAPDTPRYVCGDTARLRQVLTQIARYMIRNATRGDITLSVSCEGVTKEAVEKEAVARENNISRENNNRFCFRIASSGLLMSRHQARILFNGTGNEETLGDQEDRLDMSRRLIKLINGELEADCDERNGLMVYCRLNLALQHSSTPPALDTRTLQDLQLLLVDDNQTLTMIMSQHATMWGMSVTAVHSGEEALALIRAKHNLGEKFNVLVIDHNMPTMSGLQLAARIHEEQLLPPNAVCIMLTGMKTPLTDIMIRNVGIRRMLTKPVTGVQLQNVILEELLHQQKTRDQVAQETGLTLTDTTLPANLRVLVAEDNHLSQKVIRGMLNRLGVNAVIVGNGQEVVNAAMHGRYHVILMDCDMPDMDGFEATQRIRQWEGSIKRRSIPIIALTALNLDDYQARAIQSGMNDFINKPLQLTDLMKSLSYWSREMMDVINRT